LDTQVKLLRVLESGEFMRVGEVKMRYTDVRVIAATNKNLSELVRKGNFRQDLYYRLKTVTVDVPALRNRVEDIGPLVERFALEFTRSNDILYRGFMPEAIRVLKQYEWPGNVRELKHFVEKILVFQKGERITKDIVQNELMDVLPTEPNYNPALPVLVNQSSDKAEIDLILRQLFMLKQDTEMIQKMMVSGQVAPSGPTFPMMDNPDLRFPIPEKSMEITDEGHKLIRDDAIGDMVIKDLEEEAITRSLQYFNNNRRKTAISLGMSERTLYRKIEEFGLEPKIKKRE
jgi:DNA-binding NtrC family response regulator